MNLPPIDIIQYFRILVRENAKTHVDLTKLFPCIASHVAVRMSSKKLGAPLLVAEINAPKCSNPHYRYIQYCHTLFHENVKTHANSAVRICYL